MKKILLVGILSFLGTFFIDGAITYLAMFLHARIDGTDPEELNGGNLAALGMLTAFLFVCVFVLLYPWVYWLCWKASSKPTENTGST